MRKIRSGIAILLYFCCVPFTVTFADSMHPTTAKFMGENASVNIQHGLFALGAGIAVAGFFIGRGLAKSKSN